MSMFLKSSDEVSCRHNAAMISVASTLLLDMDAFLAKVKNESARRSSFDIYSAKMHKPTWSKGFVHSVFIKIRFHDFDIWIMVSALNPLSTKESKN